MPERLEACYHGTLRKCLAAGALLATRYNLQGNSCILEAKGTDLFSGYVFTFPKGIKETLNFR